MEFVDENSKIPVISESAACRSAERQRTMASIKIAISGTVLRHSAARLRSPAVTTLRIVLGFLLLAAAAPKGHQTGYGTPTRNRPVGIALVLDCGRRVRVVFGLWLLSGLLPRPTSCLAIGCFSLFACVSLYKAISGDATCGCFGRVPVNPWYTALIDACMTLSFLRWRPKRGGSIVSKSIFRQPLVRGLGVLATGLIVGLPAGSAMATCVRTSVSEVGEIIADGKVVVLEPERWVGRRFPLLDYIDIADRLKEGKWVVVLYRRDCPKCHQAITDLSRAALHGMGGVRIALVEVPPYSEGKTGVVPTALDFASGYLSGVREWFITTPTEVYLESGVVIKVTTGTEQTRELRIPKRPQPELECPFRRGEDEKP